jgi:hypothetical protein
MCSKGKEDTIDHQKSDSILLISTTSLIGTFLAESFNFFVSYLTQNLFKTKSMTTRGPTIQARRTKTKETWKDNVAAGGRIRMLFVNNKVNASIAIHIIVLSLREGIDRLTI